VFEPTPLPGLLVVRPARHADARGFFSESWSRRPWAEAGLDLDWCQDNHSPSRDAGVLRGLHYQSPPTAQAKLVRCARGRIWDVAVDARLGSPTYGRHFGIELSPANWTQLFLPRGFLHGFLTLEPDTEVQYKADAPYSPECDGAVLWSDPALAIPWPLSGSPVLSAKDSAARPFADWQSPFRHGDAP